MKVWMTRLFTAALLPGLAACQSTDSSRLSLEEAKQITASFDGASFAPPPRTINDIIVMLDEQGLSNPKVAKLARDEARKEPSSNTVGDELAKFYLRRGNAAFRIGDMSQALADFRQAERLTLGSYSELRAVILEDLGSTEMSVGNYRDGLRHFEQGLRFIGVRRWRKQINYQKNLAKAYARAGDFENADYYMGLAEDNLRRYLNLTSSVPAHKAVSVELKRANEIARVENAKAVVLDRRGLYAEAEPLHRSVMSALPVWIRNHKISRLEHSKESKRTDFAKNLYHQGQLGEAEVILRSVLVGRLSRVGKYSLGTANVLRHLSNLVAAQGRPVEAEELARITLDIYLQIGAVRDSLYVTKTRAALGKALVAQRRWSEALREVEVIMASLASDPETFQRVFANNPNWIVAHLGLGQSAEALEMAREAHVRTESIFGPLHYKSAEVRGLLGVAQFAEGDRAGAYASFAAAVPILISRASQSPGGDTTKTGKSQRLKTILESYMRLLDDIRGTSFEREKGIDAVAESFRIADVGRSRTVQVALSASTARAAAGDPDLADLTRREQDAQRQIAALFGVLADVQSSPTDQQDADVIASLRRQLDEVRGARDTLASEIEQQFPDYAELINPKPPTVASARAALQPEEALIAIYVGEDRSYVWAVPATGEVSFSSVPWTREQMSAVVRKLRAALDPKAQTLGDIPEFDVRLANELYGAVLEPVKVGWQDAHALIVVTHGSLGQLPMSLLVSESTTLPRESGELFSRYRSVPWLVRERAITVLPSAASLVSLRALPASRPDRRAFLGFGDPYFSIEQAQTAEIDTALMTTVVSLGTIDARGVSVSLRSVPQTQEFDSADLTRLPRLPDTAEEISAIATAVGAEFSRDVFLGERATEQAVKTVDLDNYKVLAFATHGLVAGDLDGLRQPALALSTPILGNTEGDGLLTMSEILALKIDADWVVLSACNTATADGAGSEAFSGLGRAFFYAGTRAMLLSNWPVETTSAKALTTDLFKRQARDARLQRGEALRQSMLGLIDGPGFIDPKSNRVVFSYAHPIFWAPFSLVGDGGAGNN